MWSDLILSYAKSKQIYSIALNELYQSPICCNMEINRRLSMDNILYVSEWMQKNSKIILSSRLQNLLNSLVSQRRESLFTGDQFKRLHMPYMCGPRKTQRLGVSKRLWTFAKNPRAKTKFSIKCPSKLFLRLAMHCKKSERQRCLVARLMTHQESSSFITVEY